MDAGRIICRGVHSEEFKFERQLIQDLYILPSCSCDNQDWPDSEITCSIEHSFSILRRVKIWIRSTMEDERLSKLCMLSVYWKRV